MELLPREQISFQRMLDTIRQTFERFGFLPVETPVRGLSEGLMTKSGGETGRQVYFVQSAGALALKEASNPSTVALLEPLAEVSVTVNDEYLGAVMTDLSTRRGQMLGPDSSGSGKSPVTALVPQSELSRYAIDLRGLARGSGAFSRKFHGYEVMPTNLAQQYMKA